MEIVAQIFGMTFIGIVLICLVWTILSYIFNNIDDTANTNKKLLDNMNKMDKQQRK